MSEELPEGWVSAPLGELVDILDNRRVPINSEERAKRPGNIPYYGATGQVGWIDDYLFDEELVLVGEDGAPFLDKSKTIAYLVQGKSWVNNHAHVLRARRAVTSNTFVKFALDRTNFEELVNGTTRLKLTRGAMVGIPIHLPPIAEQHRIVAKVEALLDQVNRAQARLDRVPLILNRFRQAVLAAACSGKLTEQWREAHPGGTAATNDAPPALNAPEEAGFEVPEGWRWVDLGSLARFINGDRSKNYPSKAHRVAEGIPFINAGHLRNGMVDCSEMDFITEQRFDLLRGGKVQEGDVLYCLRGSLGKSALVAGIPRGAIASSLVILRVQSVWCSPKFILQYLMSPLGQSMIRRYDNGSAQPNLSAGDVAKYDVPLPPLAEQHQIVEEVGRLFALADTIEGRIQGAAFRAGKLPESVLSRAFSGELVPTEAELARAEGRDYETAAQLLERIKASEEGAPNGERTRKRREASPARRAGPRRTAELAADEP